MTHSYREEIKALAPKGTKLLRVKNAGRMFWILKTAPDTPLHRHTVNKYPCWAFGQTQRGLLARLENREYEAFYYTVFPLREGLYREIGFTVPLEKDEGWNRTVWEGLCRADTSRLLPDAEFKCTPEDIGVVYRQVSQDKRLVQVGKKVEGRVVGDMDDFHWEEDAY